MKKLFLLLIMTTLYSSSLLAKTYTLNPGWNLLGAYKAIPVSNVLANTDVKNILIYQDGVYLSTASNQFTTIPEGSGFFVYADTTATITIEDSYNIPSSTVQKLDGNLNPTESADWPILKIVDANLLIEMKTSTYNAGLQFTYEEAEAYCTNLVIGSTSGWRLPTAGEFEGIISVYNEGNSMYFKISDELDMHRTSTFVVSGQHSTARFYDPNNRGDYISRAADYETLHTICIKDSN